MKKLLFALIALCMSISANAQFYGDTSAHLYVPAGANPQEYNTLIMIIFKGDKLIYRHDDTKHFRVKDAIKNGAVENYIMNWYNKGFAFEYEYRSEFSSSDKYTYRRVDKYYPDDYQESFIFNKDKKEFRTISIDAYGNSRESKIGDSKYFVEIKASDIVPTTPKRDFLYE